MSWEGLAPPRCNSTVNDASVTHPQDDEPVGHRAKTSSQVRVSVSTGWDVERHLILVPRTMLILQAQVCLDGFQHDLIPLDDLAVSLRSASGRPTYPRPMTPTVAEWEEIFARSFDWWSLMSSAVVGREGGGIRGCLLSVSLG